MRAGALAVLALVGGCVYFNAMYDANREYDAGLRDLQEDSNVAARIRFDSVIAKTGRIVEGHPTSKYADDAAILKTRAELHNAKWESALETARTAAALSDDDLNAAIAQGLGAVALRQLGEVREADSLLTRALSADLDADDRALFLFERGLARQELGRTEEAAADLELAASDIELSPEGRLTLSIALRDIGEYARSAQLAAPLLEESQVNMSSPLYQHVDSLVILDPAAVDSVAAGLLDSPGLQDTRAAAYQLLRATSAVYLGDTALALSRFNESIEMASAGVAAADAAYWIIELQLAMADAPDDINSLTDMFPIARRSTSDTRRRTAVQRGSSTDSFGRLVDAYESRGAAVAEAALRAAEIAHVDLEAAAVARGLYLLYIAAAPTSQWTAKAIVGAISLSGHTPDPAWVRDDGQATDDALRQQLMRLPQDDPYRLVLTDPMSRTPAGDSAYVLAESNLQQRLDDIRRQFGGVAGDTLPARPDSAAVDRDEVEF